MIMSSSIHATAPVAAVMVSTVAGLAAERVTTPIASVTVITA
jgi:hypothetical protein